MLLFTLFYYLCYFTVYYIIILFRFLYLEYLLIIKMLCLLSLYNILCDLDGFCRIFQRLEGSGPSMQLLSSILSVFPNVA